MRLAWWALGSALVSVLAYVLVMARWLPPELGLLPALPPAYAAIVLGIQGWRKEKGDRGAAVAGLLIGAVVAIIATALVIFL